MTWLRCPPQYLGAGVSVVHIIPLSDLREHERDICCWCKPRRDDNIIVHNFADSREKFETGERTPS